MDEVATLRVYISRRSNHSEGVGKCSMKKWWKTGRKWRVMSVYVSSLDGPRLLPASWGGSCIHKVHTHPHIRIILAHAHTHTHNTQRSSEDSTKRNPNRQSLSALLSGPVVGSILAVGPLKRLPRGAHQVLPQRSGSLTPLNYPRPLREGDNLCRKNTNYLGSLRQNLQTFNLYREFLWGIERN